MSLEIYPILCNAGFMDNYAYVLIDSETKVSAIVDAAEEKPIVEFCQKQDIIPFDDYHHSRHKRQLEHHMENLTGGTPPVRPLPCVGPCKLYFG